MSLAQRGLKGLCFATLVSLFAWPLLTVAAVFAPETSLLERVASLWFELHCHRDPARTPFLLGVPLGVCARCSGIYFGLGLGAALRWPVLPARTVRFWVLGAAALMLADIAFERYQLHGAWMQARVFTGIFLAYPVGAGLALLLLSSRAEAPRVRRPSRAKVR